MTQPPPVRPGRLRLGLRANLAQFSLLVGINALVGGMVGQERSLLSLLATQTFGLAAVSAALTYIVAFDLTKATTNFLAGTLADRYGRKPVLVAGWLVGLPVPLLLIWAPTWSWIVAANILLGINQGLCWSTTVVMKIDLAGPRRRGLALGLNEFAGYLAVALAALATGYLAARYGLRPEPFYLGIAITAAAIVVVVLFVRETEPHAALEGRLREAELASQGRAERLGTRALFRMTWRDPALSSISQAGLVNNLNDGLAWGLFPLFFAAAGLTVSEIGTLAFIYPAVWGVLQLATGPLSDRYGRKRLIAGGMLLQGGALFALAKMTDFGGWAAASAVLGAGTAMVYPTLLASIGDTAHPRWRGSAVGMYRLWRDSGYVVGAVVSGMAADRFGMPAAIQIVAMLTIGSGLLVMWRMPEAPRRLGELEVSA